jgi:hypothetical protein
MLLTRGVNQLLLLRIEGLLLLLTRLFGVILLLRKLGKRGSGVGGHG